MTTYTFSLVELAQCIDGELLGDAKAQVNALSVLSEAKSTDVTFISDDKYLPQLALCQAAVVVMKADHAEHFKGNKIVVADPYLSFAKLSKLFDPREKRQQGVHPSAVIHPTAQLSKTASIGANVVIGQDVVIGDNVEIYPNVTIAERCVVGANTLIYSHVSLYSDVRLGESVLIHSGTVIGSDGFGFAPTKKGWQKIHQLGGVKIGNHVEIGSNTSIDRGALSDTVIADHVIIDNLVHIAHNVYIGEASAIAGCVGIAGSAIIGKRCVVAGAVAINGHIEIADNTQFHGGSIVTKGNKEAGIFASASPLQDVRQWRKSAVRYTQIDSLFSRVKALEKKLNTQ